MMNEQGLMRLARDVYGYEEVLSITAEEALYLQQELMARPVEQFAITARTYHRLLWRKHCTRAYQFPRRKLRKCAMRRVYHRRQHERRRYLP